MERKMSLQGLEILQSMLSEGKFCDVTLRSNDSVEFKVHRAVLCMCSPYFIARFSTELTNDSGDEEYLTMQDLNSDILGTIIDYAYTRVTKVSWENVEQLLPAVDQFLVDGMKKDCCNFLKDQLNAENCIGIRRFADIYFAPELKQAAEKYLLTNFVEVVQSSEEFMELDVEEVINTIGSEELNVRHEEVVFEAIIKWIDHCTEERQQYIVRLLRCVRLGLLDNHYFDQRVKNHPYVAGNDECRPLITETLKYLYDLETLTQRDTEVVTPVLAQPRLPSEILLAIGGWSGGSPTAVIESYDTRANRWIQIEEQDPKGPRAYHKCAVIDFDVYVIGGFDGIEYFNSCRCFNVVKKEWREVGPMNIQRCYVSVVVLDKVIYAMGGYNGHLRQNSAERYDYITNQWSMIAPMHSQRSDAGATVLNGLIYIVGGFNGHVCLRTAEFYDPATNIWTLIEDMSCCRSGVSCMAFQGSVYALGGFDGQIRLNTVEKYNPRTRHWTPIPSMFVRRSNFAVQVMDGRLFAIGGFNGVTTIFHVECYDAEKDEWSEVADMYLFRSALAACVIFGMPNIKDFVHEHRDNMMEEKRQKLLQIQSTNYPGHNTSSVVLL